VFRGQSCLFIQLASVLIVQTILAATYALLAHDSEFAVLERMAMNLLPLVPALLFAWYVLRQRMLPLVMERTLVYGAALAVGLLLHRMTISRYSEKLSDRLNLDTVLLEAIVMPCADSIVPPHASSATGITATFVWTQYPECA
jgi:hypothetical protein